jgi:hypothetical protein
MSNYHFSINYPQIRQPVLVVVGYSGNEISDAAPFDFDVIGIDKSSVRAAMRRITSSEAEAVSATK